MGFEQNVKRSCCMSEYGSWESGVGGRGSGVDIPTPDPRIPGAGRVGWAGWGGGAAHESVLVSRLISRSP